MSVELKTQPCHETFLGLTATFDFGLPDQRYLRFRAGMEVSHYKAKLCYFLILKSITFSGFIFALIVALKTHTSPPIPDPLGQ